MFASVVLTDSKLAAARANAAAALRNAEVSSFDNSPTPIKILAAPFSAGTTYAWPTLPVKPKVSRVARESDTSFGNAPSLDTGMPTAFAFAGDLATTSKLSAMTGLLMCDYSVNGN